MALTLTEDFRAGLGGKAFRMITVTHDEATSTFSAASVDMDQFEFVMAGTPYLSSTPADTSTLLLHMAVSIIGDGDTIEFLLPPNAGSKTRLMLIGW